jgi:hypothetical protein
MKVSTPRQPEKFSFSEPLTGVERPVWPDGRPSVTLERVTVTRRFLWFEHEREEFKLLQRIRYYDKPLDTTITVPAPMSGFRTDLTSVPAWFTWLVPKSGSHLPAALIHDGLIPDRHGPQTYVSEPRRQIDRIDADRIFRDAMVATGVGPVRSWLVWAAVSTASLVLGPRTGWAWWKRAWFAGVVIGTVLAIVYLGMCATADLADRDPRFLLDLGWIVEGPTWREVVTGLAGAVVIPLAASVLWLRWWRVGAITGVALASLVHVTVAVALVAVGYQVVEQLAVRARWVAVALAGGVILAALVVFVGALLD